MPYCENCLKKVRPIKNTKKYIWEDWFIENYHKENICTEKTLSEIQIAITENLNLHHSNIPGRVLLERVCQKYPGLLLYKRSNNKITIKFL